LSDNDRLGILDETDSASAVTAQDNSEITQFRDQRKNSAAYQNNVVDIGELWCLRPASAVKK